MRKIFLLILAIFVTGAAKDSWFQHIALEVPGENTKTTWHGFLPAEEYAKLK